MAPLSPLPGRQKGCSRITKEKIEKIILAGAGCSLPGLRDFFSGKFQIITEITNPFSGIIVPAILEEKVKDIGPNYAIALGESIAGLK